MLVSSQGPKESPNFAERTLQPRSFGGVTEILANRMGVSTAYLADQADNSSEVNKALMGAWHADADIGIHKMLYKSESKFKDNPNNSHIRQTLRQSGIDYAKNYSKLQSALPQPTELFTHIPGQTVVHEAFSDPSMRATIPIMGAYFHQKYGTLTASSDLSEHSSKMVRHAKKLDLPVVTHGANPSAVRSNDLGFMRMNADYTDRMIGYSSLTKKEELSPEEVASAKKHYRTIRGIGKSQEEPKSLGPQFQQPKLPGMENF